MLSASLVAMSFLRAADLRTFESATAPRAHLGESWLHFEAASGLFGVVLWGTPNGEATRQLVASLRLELAPGVQPHRSLVDTRRLVGVDAGAFEALHAYVTAEREALARAVTRLALVRPSGMAGAVASGFYEVLDSPYPVELFERTEDALVWLDEGTGLTDSLDELVVGATGRSALLARLSAVLEQDLAAASPASAARTLGLSERTLQRRLQQEGTTFANELAAARLAFARRRMLETDEPLAAIALEAGYSSQQHFSNAFRAATGETPSAWRRQARPAS